MLVNLTKKPRWLLAASGALLLIVALCALQSGAMAIDVSNLLAHQLRGVTLDETEINVLLHVRLPRVLFAVAMGGALAISGATMQALFRNPLAEPSLIGVSAGAVLGVMVALLCGLTGLIWMGMTGFAGALIATTIAYLLGRRYRGVGGLLLAGIAINAFAMSLVSLATSFTSDSQFRSFAFWTLGSLSRVNWSIAQFLLPWTLMWSFALCLQARVLNALLLGEREAHHLGYDLHRVRRQIVVAMAMLVGPLVAFAGSIGFIGLVIPHLIRIWLGPDHRLLLPMSWLGGALALLLADWLARVAILPAELPVGVITSLIGGPFFLWLLTRKPNT